MAWFKNHYRCAECGNAWACEGSHAFEDNCPECGAGHVAPAQSEDMSFMIVPRGAGHTVLRARPSTSERPEYVEVAAFARRDSAEECLAFLSVSRPARREKLISPSRA